jgi:hypothetical protein
MVRILLAASSYPDNHLKAGSFSLLIKVPVERIKKLCR